MHNVMHDVAFCIHMPSVHILGVIILSVIMLSVMAPLKQHLLLTELSIMTLSLTGLIVI
jgi:hypothetical protein